MRLVLDTAPHAKARHRHMLRGSKVITFDPQSHDKLSTKWMLNAQMREKGLKTLQDGPMMLTLINHTPIPQSWSKKRQKEVEGMPCPTKPDLDNYLKFYCDALNGIAYSDDHFITQTWSEKVYSATPRVEIEIQPLGVNMVDEHAITIRGEISISDLEFLIKKAHRIGQQGRLLTAIFCQTDEEGRHIYFHVSGFREKAAAG